MEEQTYHHDKPEAQQFQRRAAFACVIGNFLEYYDFALYGFFATAVGAAFFPGSDPTVQLLQSLAVFGVAFAMRPLGGVVFGLIGDRAGRRTSLSASILVMGVATMAIGLLPSYAAIGVLAPVLLVLLRCVQGLSVGGEWGASSAFLIESAPKGKRGVRGSLPSVGAACGLIVGSLLALLLGSVMSEAALNSWGWRVPFILAAPLGMLGLYMRYRLEDTPVFQEMEKKGTKEHASWKDSIARDKLGVIGVTFAFSWICGVGLFYLGTYVVNFLSETVELPRTEAVLFTAVGLAIYASLCPIAGRISDKVGRRKTLLFGCAGHLVMGIPMFAMMASGEPALIVTALVIFAIIQAPINANTSLVLIELFPASTRLTGGSIGFNLGVGPPSGFGPFVAAGLVTLTGIAFAPAFFLSGVALICGFVLYRWLPETAGRDLHSDEIIELGAKRTPKAAPLRARGGIA